MQFSIAKEKQQSSEFEPRKNQKKHSASKLLHTPDALQPGAF